MTDDNGEVDVTLEWSHPAPIQKPNGGGFVAPPGYHWEVPRPGVVTIVPDEPEENVPEHPLSLTEVTEQCLADSERYFPRQLGVYNVHNPVHNALALCGEAGEVANYVKKYDRGSISLAELKEALTGELADVLIYLHNLAGIMKIDLEGAYLVKRHFNEQRFVVHRKYIDAESSWNPNDPALD